jgi:PAS domain S-box-containing protein
MRISVKITLGVCVVAALVAAVGFLTNVTDQGIQAQVEHLSRSSLIQVVDAADMMLAIQSSHDALRDLIARQRSLKPPLPPDLDPESNRLADSVQKSLKSFKRNLDQSAQAARKSFPGSDGSDHLGAKQAETVIDRYQQLTTKLETHWKSVNRCLELIKTDPQEGEKFFKKELDTHLNDVLLPLVLDQKFNAEADFSREVHSIERAVATANVRNTIATLSALIAALLLGLFLSRSIGKPLAELKAAVLKIGQGRLDTRLKARSRDEIGVLANTFNRMAEKLQATTVSKAYVDDIVESMSEMLIVTDPELRIRLANGAALGQLGYTGDELVDRPLASLLGPRLEPPGTKSPLESLLGTHELSLTAKNGRLVLVHWAGSELRGAAGELQGLVCAALNIAERKETEERLRASLDEKEVLLKEVHHRVKNNLQIISSLLALQARGNGDPEVRRMFEESQGRIRSMALIHEQLYQSGELSRVDFLEYVRRLCSYLIECSGDQDGRVSLRLDVAAVPLPLNLAIPCGMILNELVSNALKHAFPAGRRGTVSIGFESRGGDYRLSVSDDGVGTAAAEPPKPGSLGLKVVDALVKQIGGAMSVTSDRGTRFTITFSDVADRPPRPHSEAAPATTTGQCEADIEGHVTDVAEHVESNGREAKPPRDETPALAGASGSSQP